MLSPGEHLAAETDERATGAAVGGRGRSRSSAAGGAKVGAYSRQLGSGVVQPEVRMVTIGMTGTGVMTAVVPMPAGSSTGCAIAPPASTSRRRDKRGDRPRDRALLHECECLGT